MEVKVDQIKLISSRLFSGLKFNEINDVMREAEPIDRAFRRGDVIWREGDAVDGIGLLESGSLLCQNYQADGKTLLARVFVPPELINIEAAVSRMRTSPTFVTAAMPGSFVWFPFSNLFENPKIPGGIIQTLQANLLSYLADDCIRFMRKSDILSHRTIRDRVRMFLNILREKQGDEVDIGMSQEEFAQFLCVDRTSLSEELNKMRRDGLIEFRKKHYTLHYPDPNLP
jgi:CRP-like cAMP-binding protein